MILTRGTYTRKGKWDDSFIEKAYQLCILGATHKVLSVALGVDISTIENWKSTKPAFTEAIDKGVQEINKEVAFSFVKEACGYPYEEEVAHVVDGEVVKTTLRKWARGNPWAAKIWLSIHMPESWGNTDKTKEGNTIININKIDMNILSTDELRLMKSIAEKNNLSPDSIEDGK